MPMVGDIHINLNVGDLLRSILSLFGLFKSKRELTVELCRSGIRNHGDYSKPSESDVEILLRISNPTNEKVGIQTILVEDSSEKDYSMAVSMQEVVENEYRPAENFVLEPQETKLIRLVDHNGAIKTDKDFVSANVNIYGVENKIIQSLPVKLYIGYN